MLKADRAHLESRMRQLAVVIREKEFGLFHQNLQVLGKQAAFLTGQGFVLLHMKIQYVKAVNESYGCRSYDSTPEILFAAAVSFSIGFNVLVVAITSWSLVFGADLGIRGEDFESMKRATEGMYEERKWAVRIYLAGIASFILSGVLLGWLSICRDSSRYSVMAVFIVTGVVVSLWLHHSTRPRFRVPKEMRGANKPQAYLMGSGAFDPERGAAVHHGAASPLSSSGGGGHGPRLGHRSAGSSGESFTNPGLAEHLLNDGVSHAGAPSFKSFSSSGTIQNYQ